MSPVLSLRRPRPPARLPRRLARRALRALLAFALLHAAAVQAHSPARGNGWAWGHDRHRADTAQPSLPVSQPAPQPAPSQPPTLQIQGPAPLQPVPDELPPRIVVRLRVPDLPPGASAEQILEQRRTPPSTERLATLAVQAGVGLAHHRALPDGSHVLVPDRMLSAPELTQVLARLRASADVEQLEEDRRVGIQHVPSDPDYLQLWNLRPRVPASSGADFETAWDLTRGAAEVVVAVIDTGLLPHPDLVGAGGTLVAGSGNLASDGYDFISDCRVRGSCAASTPGSMAAVAPTPGALDLGDWISASDRAVPFFASCAAKDSSWHGTHVAGVTSALGDNNAGVVGGAYHARLLPVRALGKCGGYISDVAESIRWAAGVHPTITNPTPARVINLSLGAAGSCGSSLQSAIDSAVAAGAVVVVAAGNDAGDAAASMLPSCNNVVTVAASTQAGDAAYYTNRSRSRVALSAPGGDTRFTAAAGIRSTSNTGTTAHDAGGWTYVGKQGTSSATPHVAAAAALMLSRNPQLSPAQLAGILAAPDAVAPFAAGTSCASAGDCGSGILDAAAAVTRSAPLLVPSAATLDFGALRAPQAASREVTIRNDTTVTATVERLSLQGASGYRIAVDECSLRPLGAGASCRVQVDFSASVDGLANASLLVPSTSSAGNTLTAVALVARVGSKITAASQSASMGSVPAGTSASIRLAFQNRSEASERLAGVAIAGNSPAALASDGCSNTVLAPQASCEVSLTVTPAAEGPFTVDVSATTIGAQDLPFSIRVSGNATAPGAKSSTDAPGAGGVMPLAGGGGCSVLAGDAPPDAGLAALALLAAGALRLRRRRHG